MARRPGEDQMSAFLEEAAETHHRVYRITDGTDDDWASWCADRLVHLWRSPALSPSGLS